MIFSFLSGVSHGAILLVTESAPLLEDDEDVFVVSRKSLHQNFPLNPFFPHCLEVLQVFCVEVHCFFQAVTGLCRKAKYLPHWNTPWSDETGHLAYYRVHHHQISNHELLLHLKAWFPVKKSHLQFCWHAYSSVARFTAKDDTPECLFPKSKNFSYLVSTPSSWINAHAQSVQKQLQTRGGWI